MTDMPRDNNLEAAFALAKDGYTFIQKRCRRLNTDVFETRLMLQKTTCMLGEEAARLFYDETRFQRKGAVPGRMQKTLLGKGSVVSLDDEAHRVRKSMFMGLMSRADIDRLKALAAREWELALTRWEAMPSVVLLDEVHQLLCRAVCAWAGVPLSEAEVEKRTAQLVSLFESPAKIGLGHWAGRRARQDCERWCADLIEQVRTGRSGAEEGLALAVVAHHKDANGQLMQPRLAAVELLNVLRPTVAVARYVVFAAKALHEYPDQRQRIAAGDDELVTPFIQEVRRFYAFFPFAVARVREAFVWKGYPFPKGRQVMLDLFGTNHDPRLWPDPDRFEPERFRNWDKNPFSLIPQGGGDHYQQHRCAGEWITLALMEVAIKALTRDMRYQVPEQDLTIKLNKIPAAPQSGFVMEKVQRIY